MPPPAARGERVERGLELRLIALGAEPLQLVELHLPHGGIVDAAHLESAIRSRAGIVDADHRLQAAVDAGLGLGGGFLDAELGMPASIALAMPPSSRLLEVTPGFLASSCVSRST